MCRPINVGFTIHHGFPAAFYPLVAASHGVCVSDDQYGAGDWYANEGPPQHVRRTLLTLLSADNMGEVTCLHPGLTPPVVKMSQKTGRHIYEVEHEK